MAFSRRSFLNLVTGAVSAGALGVFRPKPKQVDVEFVWLTDMDNWWIADSATALANYDFGSPINSIVEHRGSLFVATKDHLYKVDNAESAMEFLVSRVA